jgi:hypothetical protein
MPNKICIFEGFNSNTFVGRKDAFSITIMKAFTAARSSFFKYSIACPISYIVYFKYLRTRKIVSCGLRVCNETRPTRCSEDCFWIFSEAQERADLTWESFCTLCVYQAAFWPFGSYSRLLVVE